MNLGFDPNLLLLLSQKYPHGSPQISLAPCLQMNLPPSPKPPPCIPIPASVLWLGRYSASTGSLLSQPFGLPTCQLPSPPTPPQCRHPSSPLGLGTSLAPTVLCTIAWGPFQRANFPPCLMSFRGIPCAWGRSQTLFQSLKPGFLVPLISCSHHFLAQGSSHPDLFVPYISD